MGQETNRPVRFRILYREILLGKESETLIKGILNVKKDGEKVRKTVKWNKSQPIKGEELMQI